jgi:Flp pilus assembly secretin CpaC
MFEANRRIFLQSFAIGAGTLAASQSFAAGSDGYAAGYDVSAASEYLKTTMTPMLRACVLGVILLLTTISVTWAADQTIALKLGVGSPLILERPFKTVLIGDPDVVDVHTRNDRSVILEPLDIGATNLVFVDERSIAIANVRILVCAGAIRVTYQDGLACE